MLHPLIRGRVKDSLGLALSFGPEHAAQMARLDEDLMRRQFPEHRHQMNPFKGLFALSFPSEMDCSPVDPLC